MSDALEHAAILPAIDHERLDRLTMKDRALQVALFQALINEVLPRSEELQNALNSRDCDRIRQLAHFFKGAAAQLALIALEDLCRRYEASAKAGATEEIERWAPRFAPEIERAVEEATKSGYLAAK